MSGDAPVRHVVLVGLMGAGKTTVGRELAARLGRPFVDTDDLVEATAGRTVAELFADAGEGTFRALERQAVADALAAPEPLVVACGGGVVVDPDNRRHLREQGFVVWLQAAPDALSARVGAGEDRPLLAGGAPAATLARLAALRHDAYAAVADATVTTDGRSIEEVTDAVLQALPG